MYIFLSYAIVHVALWFLLWKFIVYELWQFHKEKGKDVVVAGFVIYLVVLCFYYFWWRSKFKGTIC